MPRRPLLLVALTVAMSALAACGDVASPTQPSAIAPSTKTSLDYITPPPECRTGGWNSSTGRCE
ncbi:MAG: hypothetical protein ABIP93_04595 [Gemmatimonadaceae bacterium]